jgi:hypothetical protein
MAVHHGVLLVHGATDSRAKAAQSKPQGLKMLNEVDRFGPGHLQSQGSLKIWRVFEVAVLRHLKHALQGQTSM